MTDPAPSGLRPEEVARLVEELQPLVVGERFGKIYQLSEVALRLVIGSGATRRQLLVSTRPGFSRFHLVTEFPEAPAEPSPSIIRLRELLSGGRITSVTQHHGDRVLRIAFERGKGPRLKREVFFELFGRRGRMVVVEGKARTVRFVFGRQGIVEGEQYDPPAKSPASPASGEMTAPFEPLALIPPEERQQGVAPLHRFLAESMVKREQLADASEHLSSLRNELRRNLKNRKRLQERLALDLENARGWKAWQRRGELLQGNRQLLSRGMEEVEVVDWFEDGTPSTTITLDPACTPAENIDRCFKKARKGRRAIEHFERRRVANEEGLKILLELSETVEGYATPLEEIPGELGNFLEELQSQLRRLGSGKKRGGKRRKATSEPQKRKPYRRFVSREGLQILVGRNAIENDQLSIRDARGKDLFFHVTSKPGPHVLLRLIPGKVASPESISDAAFVAAHQSGWRGPQGILVSWTEARFVSKPRGFPPGKVRVERGREILVDFDSDRIATLAVDRGGEESR